jgi:hypothetical protein
MGATSVAKAVPDGYTLLFGGSAPSAMAADAVGSIRDSPTLLRLFQIASWAGRNRCWPTFELGAQGQVATPMRTLGDAPEPV